MYVGRWWMSHRVVVRLESVRLSGKGSERRGKEKL